MTFSESVPIALFIMMVVFGVLLILFVIIRLFSIIIGSFAKKKTELVSSSAPNIENLLAQNDPQKVSEMFSSGTLKLKNVDEPTAAMIMAIVSDESGIPLSELCFKSICLINNLSKQAEMEEM